MRNPLKTYFFGSKIGSVISKNNPKELTVEIFEIYKAKKKLVNEYTEKEISQIIFSEIYPSNSSNYKLAEENKDAITDLRHVIYCIMNMEFKGGRDIEKLSEMYLEAINTLSILNYKPATEEMKLLFRIMDKASNTDIDPVWAACLAIKSRLHYSPDYEDVIEEMFKRD